MDTILTAGVVCGMFVVLVVLFLAAILRVRRGRGGGRVVSERLAELDDWFTPGRRRQLDQERLVATARVDARTGDGGPLDRFTDAAELRRRWSAPSTRRSARAPCGDGPGRSGSDRRPDELPGHSET